MVSYLVTSLSFLLALMLQYGIFSRWTLLSGSADIVMLFVAALCLTSNAKRLWVQVLVFGGLVGAISALPFYFVILFYGGLYLFAQFVRGRILQTPLLSMFIVTTVGTFAWHGLNLVFLFIKRLPFRISSAMFEIFLPSFLLNILLSILVHSIVQESNRLFAPRGADL